LFYFLLILIYKPAVFSSLKQKLVYTNKGGGAWRPLCCATGRTAS